MPLGHVPTDPTLLRNADCLGSGSSDAEILTAMLVYARKHYPDATIDEIRRDCSPQIAANMATSAMATWTGTTCTATNHTAYAMDHE